MSKHDKWTPTGRTEAGLLSFVLNDGISKSDQKIINDNIFFNLDAVLERT